MGQARIDALDAARGVSVVMMVIYHFMFDLRYLGIADIDLQFLPVLLFQRAIGTSFLLLAGISMWVSEARGRSYEKHLQRFLKLALAAMAITLATWIYPHEGFITFGIIHLIALSTLIGPLLLRLGDWMIPLGLAILAIGSVPPGLGSDSPYLFWLGLPSAEYTALDYYPLIPWFGVVLVGMALGRKLFPEGVAAYQPQRTPLLKILGSVGRNSLAIYIAHQPILFALVLSYLALTSS